MNFEFFFCLFVGAKLRDEEDDRERATSSPLKEQTTREKIPSLSHQRICLFSVSLAPIEEEGVYIRAGATRSILCARSKGLPRRWPTFQILLLPLYLALCVFVYNAFHVCNATRAREIKSIKPLPYTPTFSGAILMICQRRQPTYGVGFPFILYYTILFRGFQIKFEFSLLCVEGVLGA